MEYKRDIEELETHAVLWWPARFSSLQSDTGIIPLLLQTQEVFVSLLKVSGKSPFAIFDLLDSTDLSANLFLKHLVVLTDLGGEPLQRINRQFNTLFQKDPRNDSCFFDFVWRDNQYRYNFDTLPMKLLNNNRLGIDGASLSNNASLSPLHKDVATILLFGSTHTNKEVSETTFPKCVIGSILGDPEEIDRYVDQRYIWVSRITGGAQSNTLGQYAQSYVVEYLKEALGGQYAITRNGKINTGSEEIPFDVVIENNGKFVGVEVSFQMTTNSVIERKANEAENRCNLMHRAGHYIAYVIDGSGNFQRKSAISKICNNSDCTVAYKNKEFDILADFIQGVLSD